MSESPTVRSPKAGIAVRVPALARALEYGAKRMAGRPYVPLSEAADRSVTLCDGAAIDALNPLVWDEHLPRIRGAAQFSVEHTITRFLKRKTFDFRPVVAHWLRDAALLDGSVYCRGYRHDVRSFAARKRIGLGLSGPAADVDTAALVSTSLGSTWWGHWLEDDVPLQLLTEPFAPAVGHRRPPYRHEARFQNLLGVVEPARYGAAVFRELMVVDDAGQNPDKTRRYHMLRARASHLPKGHDRVFLSRGASGARRILVNEAEIRTRLEGQGFHTVDVATCTAEDLIAACRGASLIVSVEGSHLAPLLYLMADFSTMVILNPPYQVQTTVAVVALFCSIASGLFICEPHGHSRTDFVADPDELLRFIDASVDFSVRGRPDTRRFLDQTLQLATSPPPSAATTALADASRSAVPS
jgi:hypothetical protein